MTSSFLVSPDIRDPMILGLTWIEEQAVIYSHPQNLIYAGKNTDRIIIHLINGITPAEPVTLDLGMVKTDFPQEAETRLLDLLQKHSSSFYREGHPTQTSSFCHRIELTSSRPVRKRPYKYPPEKKKIIQSEIESMLKLGIIEPCQSPYSSPIVLVKKKSGEPRLCIDFRNLNAITKEVTQNLPHIHQVVKEFGDSTVFTTLDLKNGYWQVPLHPDSRDYTAFSDTEGVNYRFKVMPFGLKNATGTFQTLMSRTVLHGLINECCRVYLDDIIIYSKNREEHLGHLDLVLERLSLHGLTCALKKCSFGRNQVQYLGHTITPGRNETQSNHIEAIQSAPTPTSRKDLQRFLGVCGWVREYVPHYSEITAPLTNLLRKESRRWRWNDEANEAFLNLKKIFAQPLSLSHPDPDKTFILQTHSSDIGMSAVLYQQTDDGQKATVSFASAKFSPTELRYEKGERDCLAVIWSLKHYKEFLSTHPFILRTDSRALSWLKQFKDTKSKLGRWACLLEEYSYTLEHEIPKNMMFAHALAKQPNLERDEEGDDEIEDRMVFPDEQQTASERIYLANISSPNLFLEVGLEQQNDKAISEVASRWKMINAKERRSREQMEFLKRFKLDASGLWKLVDNRWLMVVPENLYEKILFEYHDSGISGHPGGDETLRSIQNHFTWEGIREDVRDYVKTCVLCTHCKASRPFGKGLNKPRQPQQVWETVAVDLMGPYPKSPRGKQFLLVLTDLFSRWTEAFPLSKATTKKITSIIESEVFSRFGYPNHLLTDNGPQFKGKEWSNFCTRWCIIHWTTPIYHPQANPTERRNQEIKKSLRLRLFVEDHKNWDADISQILYNLRNRRNTVIGKTPSEMIFTSPPKRPGE